MTLLDRDRDERATAADGDSYDRLAELNDEWDSDDPFSTNQSVQQRTFRSE